MILKKTSKGFTLIELLVVVAIIGLLASVVIASLNTARTKGRDARRVADIRQIQDSLEMYNDANDGYPPTMAPLATTYIAIVPVDPVNTGVYVYKYAATAPAAGVTTPCPQYHLGATLETTGSAILTSAAHAAASANVCAGSVADFAGTGQIYDVKVQ